MLLQYRQTNCSQWPDQCPFITFLVFSELCLLSHNSLCFIVGIYVVHLTPFHFNLKVLLFTLFSNYFLSIASRCLVILYENEWITLEGDPENHWPILIASWFRVYYMVFAVNAVGSLAFERYFATIWAVNYEKKKRKWISYLIVSMMLISGSIVSTVILLEFFSLIPLVIIGVGTNIFFLALLRNAVIICTGGNSVCGCIMIASFSEVFKGVQAVYVHSAFNLSMAVFVIVLSLTCLLSDDSYRKQFFSIAIVRLFSNLLLRPCYAEELKKANTVADVVKNETHIYFTSLAEQWEQYRPPEVYLKKRSTLEKM
ncbi:unnamed protein product [Caenorhabditis auriculariae]|uniref:Uncharacterized protein n=1 Tax=Caenorhabditis auriculariae TaxID=2777116 RepID=A0A8S1HTT2_9PELO|nr:unnamed protein product [Caenorhabditis auriculariae]